MKRCRLICLLLAVLLLTGGIARAEDAVPANAQERKVLRYAQQVYNQEMEGRASALSYVNMLRNNKQYYLRTLNNARHYNAQYDLACDLSCTLIDIQLAVLTQDPAVVQKAAIDSGSSAIGFGLDYALDELGISLPDVTLRAFVYSQARAGADQIKTAELLDIMERAENNGGKFVSMDDAKRFLQIYEDNRMGFAALTMGRGFYMDQLNAGPGDMLKDITTHIGLSGLASKVTRENVIASYLGGKLVSFFADVLDTIVKQANDRNVTLWAEEVKAAQTEIDEYLNSLTADGLSLDLPEDMDAYLGLWQDMEEAENTLALHKRDGRYFLSAAFYRMAAFEAELAGWDFEDEALVFRAPEGFTCHLDPAGGALLLSVQAKGDFGGFFTNRGFVFIRQEGETQEGWLGRWRSADGEFLEIHEATEDGVVIVYNGLTASGESYFSTEYTLGYEDEAHTIAAEDEAAVYQKGWRCRFVLHEDCITMQSRYPDRDFFKE